MEVSVRRALKWLSTDIRNSHGKELMMEWYFEDFESHTIPSHQQSNILS